MATCTRNDRSDLMPALLVLLALTCWGCAGDDAQPGPASATDNPAAGSASPGVPLLAPPAGTEAAQLPPGHPPLDGAAGAVSAPGSGGGALNWTAPAGWVAEPPDSNMRKAQYRVPGPGGDGEFVVFYFGPGQGGDPQSNAYRWADQFAQPDGSSSREHMTFESFELNGMPVMQVEVSGTYTNRMVSDQSQPEHMLLGAIVGGGDANWFFKLTGPQATVEAQRAAFGELLASLESAG